jgi:hypothetical protein
MTLVKIPVSEISASLKKKHNLADAFSDVRIEGDCIVFYFSKNSEQANYANPDVKMSEVESERIETVVKLQRKRRAKKKRNRMKTSGWSVVAKIQNSLGQTCIIYRPFVDALKEKIPRTQQRKLVEQILRSKGNKPSEASINYFMENTLQYLQMKEKSEVK